MDGFPFVDWNGNGRIDPEDIALSLAMAEEEDEEEADEEDGENDL